MIRFLLPFIILLNFTSGYGQVVNKIDIKLRQKEDDQSLKVVVVMNDQADISASNKIKGKDNKAKFVYNTLYLKSESSQKNISTWLTENNIRYRNFYIVNMLSASVTKQQLEALALRGDVSMIVEDANFKITDQVRTIDENASRTPIWNLNQIGAPTVWSMGYTGQNVVIGGQDTGYAWDVTPIKNKYRGWNGTSANHNYNWHDAIHGRNVNNTGSNPCGYDSAVPCDDNNHGTHTMGTMVGDVDDMGQEIGVAPGAKWIGCRNMERGDGTLSTYVECFEWFLAPYPIGGGTGDPTKMPHVINNSWGCPLSEGCNTTNFPIMELALNNLRNAGCVIVVSAGNAGPGCSSVDDPAAIFEGSFSVGATNSSDNIAGFSSRGPVLIDSSNRLKPNISAPGVDVRSCLKNGTFSNLSGTSMAGPHVAGLVALLISANPELAGEVDKIEDIIEQTAVHLTSTENCPPINGSSIPNNTFGYGRIDAISAVNMALPDKYIPYFNQHDNFVISNPANGLVMVSQNGSKFRIQVDDAGQIIINTITNVSSGSTEIKNASINMVTNNSKIILRSPNNAYWQLMISNNGVLSTQIVNKLSPINVEINKDLYISAGLKGLLLRSIDNTCFLTNISNLGILLSIKADCLN